MHKKTIHIAFGAVLAVLFFSAACIAQTNFGNTAPKVISSSTVSSSDSPQKGSISLDLQVDEDSSVFTKTVMVKLENLTASEVEPFVRKGLSKYGSVSTNSNANLLVITDREPKLSDLVAFVRDMDRLGMENFVQLETEVVKLDTAQASTLLSILTPRLSSEGSIQANDTLNVLVITDVRGKIDYLKEIISQLDVPPQQMVIETQIVQVYDMDFSDVGIDLTSLLNTTVNLSENQQYQANRDWDGDVYSTRYKQNSKQFVMGNTVDEFINFLVGTGKAKLVASPSIVTVNNKQGSVLVSESSNYYYGYSDTNTVMNLIATPHLGASGKVSIDFSASSGLVKQTMNSDNSRPDVMNEFTRTVNSSIIVNEGETFVVGGMDTEYTSKVERRDKIFGSLPIIGTIFTKKVDYTQKTKILFFVTPRVLKDQSNPPDAEELKLEEE